jgi:diaminopimelate epimerase
MGDVAARPPGARLRFTKMHGAGNDFIVLDLRDEAPPPTADLCRALADRHTGAGCDQILTIEPPRSAGAVASYRIWNGDGSASQQCGNGARCVAAWLVRDGAAGGSGFALDSPVGRHAVEPLPGHRYRIAMGVPDFAPQAVPLSGFSAAQDEYAVVIDGRDIRFGAVSMGNPHLVLEVPDLASAPVAALGPALQRNAVLPQSGNIGFAEVVARDRIRLRVFERGVGETRACGSGACAAAAVMMRRGRIDREAVVSLPGGDLSITWPDDTAQITLAGPAAFVYEGEWLS